MKKFNPTIQINEQLSQTFNVLYEELDDVDNPIDILSIKPIKGELMPDDWNDNKELYIDKLTECIKDNYGW
jgi:hypothetical protein